MEGIHPAYIHGVSAIDMKDLHQSQVGKHSALLKNIILIVEN